MVEESLGYPGFTYLPGVVHVLCRCLGRSTRGSGRWSYAADWGKEEVQNQWCATCHLQFPVTSSTSTPSILDLPFCVGHNIRDHLPLRARVIHLFLREMGGFHHCVFPHGYSASICVLRCFFPTWKIAGSRRELW